MPIRICWPLMLCLSMLFADAQENRVVANNFALTLTITNPTGRQIVADIEPITLSPKGNSRNQRKVVLDGKNQGVLKLVLNGPSILKLMNAYPDSSVSYIAIPGVNMVVHVDTRNTDKTHYHDIGPAETDFYVGLIEKCEDLLKQIPQQDPVQFINVWDTNLHGMQDSVKAAAAAGMPAGYASWISQSLRSLFQAALCRQFVNYTTIKRSWPANIDDYIARFPAFTISQVNQPSFFPRETDKELMEGYYLFHSLIDYNKKGLPAPGVETTYRNAISQANTIRTAAPRSIMLRYLVTSITAHTTDTSLLNWMKNTVVFGKDNEHLDKIITEKQDLLRKLGFHQPAPYFQATGASGNKFSYEAYRGKYLFIDIWATWCVPCRKEIPYLEALKKKYAGKAIEFVSVSTDRDLGAWKKFLESEGDEQQFHSSSAAASSITEAYNAKLIPAFVLLDPQGNIINPAAFRPSDPALALLLDQLLQNNNNQLAQ